MSDAQSVSVVVPTRSRADLVTRAVRSALDQTCPPLEVVVVVDGPDPASVDALTAIGDERVRVVSHPESRGAGEARNTGVCESRGTFVAFLDDDDQWLPDKLDRQLSVLATSDPEHTLVSCQAVWDDGVQPHTWPTRAPPPGESIADYLFVRRSAGEGLLATPTLVLSRELALAHPFPTHLATHEEWDWMLDLQKSGVEARVVMEPLAIVDARANRVSISSDSKWRQSLAWGLTRAEDLGPQAYAGFVLNEAGRTAVRSGAGIRALWTILAAASSGKPRLHDVARFVARPPVLWLRSRRRRA